MGPRSDSGRRNSWRSLPRYSDRSSGDSRFPWWVVVGSTLAALTLFFTTTAPAIAEARYLTEVEQDRHGLDQRFRRDLELDALHRIGLEIDLQCLLLELDRRGIFVGPEPSVGPGAADPATDDGPRAPDRGRHR